MGRFAIGILILIAELELERIKGGWVAAVSEAVGRGVHISAQPPTGYKRDERVACSVMNRLPLSSQRPSAIGQRAPPGLSSPASSKKTRSIRRSATSTGGGPAAPR